MDDFNDYRNYILDYLKNNHGDRSSLHQNDIIDFFEKEKEPPRSTLFKNDTVTKTEDLQDLLVNQNYNDASESNDDSVDSDDDYINSQTKKGKNTIKKNVVKVEKPKKYKEGKEKYTSFYSKKRSKKRHHRNPKVFCDFCYQGYSCQGSLHNHQKYFCKELIKKGVIIIFRCPYKDCTYKYKRKNEFIHHKEKFHDDYDE